MSSDLPALQRVSVRFIKLCFCLQPGVCHSTVLRLVPSEEVREKFKLDPEGSVTPSVHRANARVSS